MLRLFTTSYDETRKGRLAEYLSCLDRNLACETIDEICVLAEGKAGSHPPSAKFRIRRVQQRPTYDDFFSWINEVTAERDVSIIANADIWFDRSIAVTERALTIMLGEEY